MADKAQDIDPFFTNSRFGVYLHTASPCMLFFFFFIIPFVPLHTPAPSLPSFWLALHSISAACQHQSRTESNPICSVRVDTVLQYVRQSSGRQKQLIDSPLSSLRWAEFSFINATMASVMSEVTQCMNENESLSGFDKRAEYQKTI